MAIQTLHDQVKELLYWEPETRNSDTLLTVKVWQRFYGIPDGYVAVPQLMEVMREAPPDNIKRYRAYFQNDKDHPKFLPTRWEVAKMRRWKEDDWKRALGYSTLTPADHIEIAEQEKHLASIERERQPSML
jgi:hypothetical protein